ncbi:Vacuolar membrane protein [Colletotrichum sidae]|uniref:Vacuolar membrane protein n=1 Tax=Colletotrichum sidae TaxID=1347389 RepID=A0A4R8TM15_9PEZI|nr:Vacuolar membrane protein [Colletotrichum sidae]
MAPPPPYAIATGAGDALLPTTIAAAVTAAAAAAAATTTSAAAAMIPMTNPAAQSVADFVTAITTAAAAKPTAAMSEGGDSGDTGDCSLLGSFALIVQAALGGLALLALVYKRWKERPQRPVKIWFFDVSKQVFGSVLVHIANIFMSMLTSGRFSVTLDPATTSNVRRLVGRDEDYTPNPCSFYLLNLAIDTTIGIPILIILLRVITGLVAYTPLGKPAESIKSGNYGSPPNAWWWLKQSFIYFCGLFGMKFCVLIIFLLLPWISRVGDWALRWTEGNEQLQIFFVMMFFPLIMNAMQYYIIDSFIKQPQTEHERLPDEDPDWSSRNAGASPYDDDESDGDGADADDSASLRLKKARQGDDAEYDPDVDGDVPTVIGSSSSRSNHQRKDISQELFPKE